MKAGSLRAVPAVVSAVAGILAGILGGWLAGRWAWGIAAGVLALIAVVALAEVLKARGQDVRTGNGRAGQDAQPGTQAGRRTVSVPIGAHATVTDSVIAAGDVDQSRHTINVDQSRTTTVGRGVPVFAAAAVCAAALLAGTGGTVYFANLPGGRLHPAVAGGHAAGSPASHARARPATGPSGSAAPIRPPAGPVVATFTETDSTGDSATQAISLGAPAPLSQFPQVAAALADDSTAGGCGSLTAPPARALAVPVEIVSTLNSAVAVKVSLAMTVNDFSGPSLTSDGLAGFVIGEFSDGTYCDNAGVDTLDNKGESDTFYAWLVLDNAITANHPAGDPAALGQTYAALDTELNGDSFATHIRAEGTGVCGDISPVIHVAGTVYSWEQCSGSHKHA